MTRKDLVPDLGVAIGTVALTAAISMVMVPWVGDRPPLILFAVMSAALTSWRGLGPGMLATSLGAPVGSILIQPAGSGGLRDGTAVEFSMMFASSMAICWLIYRLRVEQENVGDAYDRKDHALAFVSHELRQPLATVHLAATMLERDRSDDTRDRAAALIQRSAARLTKVVEDLVDVTRLRGEGLRIQPTSMRLQDAILPAVETLSPTIAQRGQSLHVNVPVEPPFWINGDLARLQQVFDNLLSNATRYSPEGAEISVSSFRSDGHAVVIVSDTGVGISRDTIDHVFEPFFRESYNSTEGLGLGLTLVRDLITKHGGRINAHSDGPGRGSTFTVELPLAPAPALTDASASPVATNSGV